MRRFVLFVWAVVLVWCFPSDANAQFFRKLGKVLEKVDKELGTSSGNESRAAAEVKTEKAASANRIRIATYKTESASKAVPHRTANTRLITLENKRPVMSGFSEGVAYVKTGGKQGGFFIDTLGNRLFNHPVGYGAIPKFNHGVIISLNNSKNTARIINKKGETVCELAQVLKVTDFVDGVAAILKGYPSKTGYKSYDYYNIYINTKGERVFKDLPSASTMESLEEVRPSRYGLSAFYDYRKKKWGYRNESGGIIIPQQFEDAAEFSDSLALVSVMDENGTKKWGYIDLAGEFEIDPIFSIRPGSFRDGLAPIKNKNEEFFYIDKTGKIVSKPFVKASEYHDGYAWIAISSNNHVNYYVMDKKLRFVSRFAEDVQVPVPPVPDGKSTQNAHALWGENGLYVYDVYTRKTAWVSPLGDTLLNGVSAMFDGNYAPCEYDNRFGYINRKGEYVIEFVESEF